MDKPKKKKLSKETIEELKKKKNKLINDRKLITK